MTKGPEGAGKSLPFVDVGERVFEGRYLARVFRGCCGCCGATFDQLRWSAAESLLRLCLACTAPATAADAPAQSEPASVTESVPTAGSSPAAAAAPLPLGIDDVAFKSRRDGHDVTVRTVLQALNKDVSMCTAVISLGGPCDSFPKAGLNRRLSAAGWVTRDNRSRMYRLTSAAKAALAAGARAST